MQLDNVKTLRDAVNYGKQFLEDFGIENAQYDATELLLLVMGISRAYSFTAHYRNCEFLWQGI